MAAEVIGFTSYPPAYLSGRARGANLLIGANFASASSGYYDDTANLYVYRLLIRFIHLFISIDLIRSFAYQDTSSDFFCYEMI